MKKSYREYTWAFIRADQEQAERQRLEAKLREAVERGDYREVTPEFWTWLKTIAQSKPTPPRDEFGSISRSDQARRKRN